MIVERRVRPVFFAMGEVPAVAGDRSQARRFSSLPAFTAAQTEDRYTGLQNGAVSIECKKAENRIAPALKPVSGEQKLVCPGDIGNRASTFLGSHFLFVPAAGSCAGITRTSRVSDRPPGGVDQRFFVRSPPDRDGDFSRVRTTNLADGRPQWTVRLSAQARITYSIGGIQDVAPPARSGRPQGAGGRHPLRMM